MEATIYHAPVYKFIFFIKHYAKDIEKKVLDCGAGGKTPPLGLFHEWGFETHGIDISEEQIKFAEDFAQVNGMKLNLIQGDMQVLPYEDESFGFVYSYNTIFHLLKEGTRKAIAEVKRVLKKGGLFYVNFMTFEDGYYGEGKEVGKGEFVLQNDDGSDRYRLFLEDHNEAKEFFEGFEIILLENRHIRLPTTWKDYEASYIDCIVKKI
ncbi:MAG: class I SAM-dependent methyltransferase [Candidatus Heimdallarchaeota archaeon]